MCAADERELRGGRSYDVAKKINKLEPTDFFVAGAGSVSNYLEIIDSAKIEISEMKEEERTAKNIFLALEKSYQKIRDEKFEKGVLRTYGVTWDEFKKGQIDPTLKGKITKAAENPNGFSVDIVAGGLDPNTEEFSICYVLYPGNKFIEDEYIPIGTGRDRADLVIGDYLHYLDRETRNNIPLELGARILLDATRSAWRNVGVGGSGELVYVDKDGYHEVGGNEVDMLQTMLIAEKKGALDKDYVNSVISSVLTGKKLEEIRPKLEEKVDKKDLVELFFFERYP